jgi:biopolymer transport protein TolQ
LFKNLTAINILFIFGEIMEMRILSLIAQASVLAQGVLVLLLVMSLTSWALMFRKWFDLNAAMKKSGTGLERFDAARDLREAVQSLSADPSSPLYAIAHKGVLEFNRSKEAGNSEEIVVDNVHRSLDQGVGLELNRLASSLSYLATAANTAPFIGLFGTVWGIMTSFQSIGMMKTASLAVVAPGISEALIATAVGLAVAIPATVGYNSFQGKLSNVETLLVNFAGMFLTRVQRELNAQNQRRGK